MDVKRSHFFNCAPISTIFSQQIAGIGTNISTYESRVSTGRETFRKGSKLSFLFPESIPPIPLPCFRGFSLRFGEITFVLPKIDCEPLCVLLKLLFHLSLIRLNVW